MQLLHSARALGLVAVAVAGLAIAGCAKDPADAVGAFGSGAGRFGANGYGAGANGKYGSTAPGTPGDFAQNVGDRVFFDTDQTDLSADRPGDARQAGPLARAIPALRLHGRGQCRRARHARVQLRPGGPARPRP